MAATNLLGLLCLARAALSSSFSYSAPFCVDTSGCFNFYDLLPRQADPRNGSRTDISFPLIGLGTAGIKGQTERIVTSAVLDMGYKLIDTAQATEWYDEAAVGSSLLQGNLSDLIIVTKIHPRSYSLERMEQKLHESIDLLYGGRKSVLDVVLLHSPRCWHGHCTREEQRYPWQQAWKNLEQLYEKGLVAAIGVSNFNPAELTELLLISSKPVSVVQNWMNPFHQDPETRRICESNDIVYMAYSSMGTQWPTVQGNDGVARNPILSHTTIANIAVKHSRTSADVILSWVLQEGAVAIPRASNEDHLRANIRMLPPDSRNQDGNTASTGVFLDSDDITAIRQLHDTQQR